MRKLGGMRTLLVVALAAGLAAAAVEAGSLFGRKDKPAVQAGAVGADLAVIDLRVHEIRTGGAEPRLVVQALVENQKPVPRMSPFRVAVRRKDAKTVLGYCEGERLPQGQVAVCELWLPNEGVRQGDVFEAFLDRSMGDFNKWDTDPTDDRRTYEIRTVTEGGQVLRLASFEVVPQTVQGSGEVTFRFQVEGAHLVWLLAEDRPPRLLAGHPADGLLQGKGRERISKSGPVTVVARNSFGSFVYLTVPVVNNYEQNTNVWTKASHQESDGGATMRILEPGVYDIDEDAVILENLRNYLQAKDWQSAARAAGETSKPRPANVLNPRARQREQAQPEGSTEQR